MIKQITCKEIKDYLKKNPKCVLLDVRTPEEWNMFGRPNGKELNLKTYFLTIQDDNFINDFKNCQLIKIMKFYLFVNPENVHNLLLDY